MIDTLLQTGCPDITSGQAAVIISLLICSAAVLAVPAAIYVLHRIKAIDGDNITLKGDGNLDGTEHCTRADVCGTVVAILRRGEKRIDCTTPGFERRSRRWVNAPRIVRRYVLGIYRRIKIL